MHRQKINKKYIYFTLLLIFILGLIPFFSWFKNGMMVASPDTTLPFKMHEWRQYFFAWNYQIGTGTEFLFDSSALIFNALPTFLQWLGISFIMAQRLQYVFWFMLPGFTMYYLMRTLTSEFSNKKVRAATCLLAVSFYMFNLYLEPIWLGFNKNNISLYAILPLLLALFIRGIDGRMNFIRAALLIGLSSLLCSIAGTNAPILCVACLPIPLYLILYIIKLKIWRNRRNFIKVIVFFILTITFCVLVNFFWILPESKAIVHNINYSKSAFPQVKNQALEYLKGVSQHTSLYNVMRMQGSWTWYTGHGEPYHPYSHMYQKNLFFILMSWLIPILVLYAIFRVKSKYKFYFTLLAVLGILFGMGVHKPFGYIYTLFLKFVPGFWIFRSAWFKFTLLTCLGYAFLLGVAGGQIYEKLKNYTAHCQFSKRWHFIKERSPEIFVFALIALILIYAYPVTFGKMFVTKEERKNLPPHHFKIPNYIDEAAFFIKDKEAQEGFFRIFVMPGRGVWANDWGYPGFYSIIKYFITSGLVYEYTPEYTLVSQTAPNVSGEIVKIARDCLNPYEGNFTANLAKILRLLSVKYMLQENDFRFDILPLPDTAQRITNAIMEQKGISKEKTFGAWDFYTLHKTLPHIFTMPKATLIIGGIKSLIALSNTHYLDNPALFFTQEHDISHDLLNSEVFERGILFDDMQMVNKKYNSLLKDKSVTLSFILSTQDMLDEVDQDETGALLKQNNLEITYGEDLSQPASLKNEDGLWRWLKNTNQPSVIIHNPYSFTMRTNLIFTTYSYGQKRMLLVNLNAKTLNLDITKNYVDVEKDNPLSVLYKNLELKSGKNIITFQTPYPPIKPKAGDYKGELAALSFGFKDIYLGDLIFEKDIYLPESCYQIDIYPEFEAGLSDMEIKAEAGRFIEIDGKRIDLKPKINKDSYRYWSSDKKIELSGASHKISFAQQFGENYFIELSLPQPPSALMSSLNFQKINATKFLIDLDNKTPLFLIFNESYHDGWRAYRVQSKNGYSFTSDKKEEIKKHFKINGYANAWFIEKPAGQVLLEYQPQKTQQLSQKISLYSLAGCLGLLIFIPLGRNISKLFRQ